MKLDRNLNGDGRGKYGLILNRKLAAIPDTELAPIQEALDVLDVAGLLHWGTTAETEFFVIRLRDEHASAALRAYAIAACCHDAEYAEDVLALANRSGIYHPSRKVPD